MSDPQKTPQVTPPATPSNYSVRVDNVQKTPQVTPPATPPTSTYESIKKDYEEQLAAEKVKTEEERRANLELLKALKEKGLKEIVDAVKEPEDKKPLTAEEIYKNFAKMTPDGKTKITNIETMQSLIDAKPLYEQYKDHTSQRQKDGKRDLPVNPVKYPLSDKMVREITELITEAAGDDEKFTALMQERFF